MIIALTTAIALLALGAWVVAVVSALAIVGLAPKGQKLNAYFALGWWRFQRVEELAGPASIPHIKRYRSAFIAFFACIMLAIAIVFLITLERQN